MTLRKKMDARNKVVMKMFAFARAWWETGGRQRFQRRYASKKCPLGDKQMYYISLYLRSLVEDLEEAERSNNLGLLEDIARGVSYRTEWGIGIDKDL